MGAVQRGVAAQRVAVWAELPAAAQQAAEGRPAVVLVAQPVVAKPAAKAGAPAVPVVKAATGQERHFRRDVQTEPGRTHPRSSSASPVIERRAKGRSDCAHTNSR